MEKGLPEFLQKTIKEYPGVWESYQGLGAAIGAVDGMDKRTQHLVKLGIAIGRGVEGGVHSHVKRCKEAGIPDKEVYHAALLAVTTIGWPSAVAALTWIDDILKAIKGEGGGR